MLVYEFSFQKTYRFPTKSSKIDDGTNYTKIQRFRKETIFDPTLEVPKRTI